MSVYPKAAWAASWCNSDGVSIKADTDATASNDPDPVADEGDDDPSVDASSYVTTSWADGNSCTVYDRPWMSCGNYDTAAPIDNRAPDAL